jgi:hypothetical protein
MSMMWQETYIPGPIVWIPLRPAQRRLYKKFLNSGPVRAALNKTVRPRGYCPPRHRHAFRPSSHELNGIL